MKIPIFPGKYHQNGEFSMAMLVYRRVSKMMVSNLNLLFQGSTLPPIIMVQWKMAVSPTLVSFHFRVSTEPMDSWEILGMFRSHPLRSKLRGWRTGCCRISLSFSRLPSPLPWLSLLKSCYSPGEGSVNMSHEKNPARNP